MFVYKIDEVIKVLESMKKDKFEYVDISVIEADEEDMTDTLSIEAVISGSETETDYVDSVLLPGDYNLNV